MAKDRDDLSTKEAANDDEHHNDRHRKSKRKKDESSSDYDSSESEDDRHRRSGSGSGRKKKRRHSRGSRRRSRDDDESSPSSDSGSGSESEGSDEGSEPDASGSDPEESEGEMRRRRKRRERKRREREHEKERRRRRKEKEKEKKRKREKEGKRTRKKKDSKKDKKKKKEKDAGKKGAVTDSWGKYGIIKETDMWNKRPEFTAWLMEVKQVNLETLPNWEEKQKFKDFMEDHNTATFPSKKYYDLDAYHRHKLEKEMKKGLKKLTSTERTVFNDEEQRRLELTRERERHKEEQVEALKRSMQSGMAQDMKDQARLREEMAYQYRVGNSAAAAAIQKRLDPDVAM